ncbi:hypothetical protein RB195_020618 [Necator americanus]|uniref:Uncharacterized protein n=1 Tax=Necator americanus TaxID=51031 RepID=A0ABR1CJY8_NECAM
MSVGISREMPSPLPEIWSSDEWMDSVRALAVDREGLDRAVLEDNRKRCGQAHQAVVSARRLCRKMREYSAFGKCSGSDCAINGSKLPGCQLSPSFFLRRQIGTSFI